MHPLDRLLSLTMAALAALAVMGLVVRGKLRACLAFPAYLGSAALGHSLVALLPATFWKWSFLAPTDALQAALRVAIALEIAHKTFGPLPRGRARVSAWMAVVLFALVPVAALQPREIGDAFELARVIEPVSYGIAFLFLVYIGAVRFYGIPIDPLHRALATGFGVASVLVGCVSLLWRFDGVAGLGSDLIVKTAYPCLLAWWAWAAWRRDTFAGLSPVSLKRLHPWRTR